MADDNRRDYAYDLRKVLEQMELDLVKNMRRNMKRHETEEKKEGFRWEMWQKAKLRSLWEYRKENKEVVEGYGPEVEKIVREALEEEYKRAENVFNRILSRVKALFRRRGMKYPKDISGHSLNRTAKPEEGFFGVNKKRLVMLQKEAEKVILKKEPIESEQHDTTLSTTHKLGSQLESEPFHPEGKEKDLVGITNHKKLDDMSEKIVKDLREVQRAAWRRMDDIYRRIIYRAGMNMAAGAKTLDQAIDMATEMFLKNGIDCIEYKNGHRVNIASYAEMALRTASQRAVLLGDGQKRDEWGIHTIIVSAHANTCPLCALWQGKKLVDDVFSGGTKEEADSLGYPLLSTAMKSGLLHPNCRHTISTYFPGITKQPDIPDEEKAAETYKAEQEQRKLERKIRQEKRKSEGIMDPIESSKARNRVIELQDELMKHLDEHQELRRSPNREKTRSIPNTGKNAKRETEKNNQEYLDKYEKRRYNIDGSIKITDDWTDKGKVSIPKKYKENAVVDTKTVYKKGYEQKDRTYYDKNGVLERQIHSGHHNKPHMHSFGKNKVPHHAHDVLWDEHGKRIPTTGREWTTQELRENKDLLR